MIRDIEDRPYQIELFSKAIDDNSLIVLPTGLGKTIIILYLTAYHLQKEESNKVVICTPTKPLVNQIAETMKNHLEIDPEIVVDVSGAITPDKRQKIYENARIIVGTPQTIDNDMILDRLPLKNISLLCLDEAHRATGNYAYVKIINGFKDEGFNPHIVGFTATPGNKKEQIIEVLGNLTSTKILYKGPKDPDIKNYISHHKPENIFVELPKEYETVLKLLKEYIKSLAYEIKKLGVEISNPDYITRTEALKIQQQAGIMVKSDPNFGNLLNYAPNLIRSLHIKDIIETQGFPQATSTFEKWTAEERKGKTLKEFLYRMNEYDISHLIKNNPMPHPKLEKLFELLDAENLEGESKIIIFSNYRDSVRFLEKELKEKNYPCDIFLGQSSGKKKKGMSQKEQLEVLERFKHGDLHILLSTSVGEEGLDVGSCDLVVFYDSVPSVIRSVQRTGRGRKRKSKVIRLITKGTKDEGMYYATKNREKKIEYLMRKELPELLRMGKESKEGEGKEERYNEKQIPKKAGLLKHFAAKTEEPEKEKIMIIVDSRETKSMVPRVLKKEGAMIESTTLDIGDYQISQRCFIERKTTNDFVDSLIDGRLFKQSLSKMAEIQKPVYLIEGTWKEVQRNIPINNIMAAVATIISNYNFTIIMTENEEETGKMIYQLARREQKKHKKPKKKISITKKENINDIQEAMIAQIVGMNVEKTEALLKKFKTIKEIAMVSEKELAETLGIGKVLAKRITEVMRREYSR